MLLLMRLLGGLLVIYIPHTVMIVLQVGKGGIRYAVVVQVALLIGLSPWVLCSTGTSSTTHRFIALGGFFLIGVEKNSTPLSKFYI
jgi:hypothetical protein